MRAADTVHQQLALVIGFMHAARWQALWRAVMAALRSEQLWLTALGRARPGEADKKHGIKAVDRLLGNEHLHAEERQVYRAIASVLLRKVRQPILLVDTVELRKEVYALSAAVAFDGRSFPIYSLITDCVKPRKPVFRELLDGLAQILPRDCQPIFVTDAGFETPWLEAVDERGWHYVGRIRNNTKIRLNGEWRPVAAIYKKATKQAKNLGHGELPRKKPRRRRLVLSKRPRSGHRRRMTSHGKPGQRKDDRHYSKTANEPWLLATSLECGPAHVVEVYGLRMQVEQSFRDLKNHRWGWSLRHCGSRCTKRIAVLLLIGALACLVQQAVGIAGEAKNLQWRHQANTERRRRVLSVFVLGGLLLREARPPLSGVDVRSALSEIRRRVRTLSRLADP